jgi:hypothetical protein
MRWRVGGPRKAPIQSRLTRGIGAASQSVPQRLALRVRGRASESARRLKSRAELLPLMRSDGLFDLSFDRFEITEVVLAELSRRVAERSERGYADIGTSRPTVVSPVRIGNSPVMKLARPAVQFASGG